MERPAEHRAVASALSLPRASCPTLGCHLSSLLAGVLIWEKGQCTRGAQCGDVTGEGSVLLE